MLRLNAFLSVLLFAVPSWPEATREVRGPRIELGEVVPSVAEEMKLVDLGRSPPPGGARVMTRAEIQQKLTAAGFDARGVTLPETTRVQSLGRKFSSSELAELVRPAVERSLPRGVQLSTLTTSVSLTLSPDTAAGTIQIPPVPKRIGASRIGLSVELQADGETTHRLPVIAVVLVQQAAAEYAVKRGSSVRLVVRSRNARIAAEAVALENADVDQIASFRVLASSKTLKARVISAFEAVVAEGQ